MPTTLRRITFGGSAWTRRGNPPRAELAAEADVEGFGADMLADDLARALAARLPWAVVGETVIPVDALPRGVIPDHAHRPGALFVHLQPNESPPEYVEGGALPDGGTVRLMLVQPMTTDLQDAPLLIERRLQAVDVLAGLSGRI